MLRAYAALRLLPQHHLCAKQRRKTRISAYTYNESLPVAQHVKVARATAELGFLLTLNWQARMTAETTSSRQPAATDVNRCHIGNCGPSHRAVHRTFT